MEPEVLCQQRHDMQVGTHVRWSAVLIGAWQLILPPIQAQSATSHDSSPSGAAAERRQARPHRLLGQPRVVPRQSPRAFTGIQEALITAEGLIVVAHRNGRQLTGLDRSGEIAWTLEASPNPGSTFRAFTNLLFTHGTQVMVWDAQVGRFTIIDHAGRTVEHRRIRNPPDATIPGGRARRFLTMHGQFDDGSHLATVRNNMYSLEGVQRDTTPIYRVTTDGELSELGRRFQAERYLYGGGRYAVFGDLPFGRHGSLAVAGSHWYYTDGARFEIEARDTEGRLRGILRSGRSRQGIELGDILRSRHLTLARANARLKPDVVKSLAWMPYPDSVPAYGDLKVDPHGNLWAAVWAPEWEPTDWDVFSPDLRRLGGVRTPAGFRLLAIGSDVFVGMSTDSTGSEQLVVIPTRRP